MKGIETNVKRIRRKIFEEIAKFAYEGKNFEKLEELPHKIIEGEKANFRSSVYLERAIVGQRLRLAMGLSLNDGLKYEPVSKDIEKAIVGEKYYELPLVNVIKSACNACPENEYFVTNSCQGCLAKPCQEVCPKNAVSTNREGKSVIDKEKCIRCGRCAAVCPYSAIVQLKRPCSSACGVDAIGSDEHNRAEIDEEKCVSCGACTISCPFGAISDKSQIFQVIYAMQHGKKVVAAVAPAFVGQFGDKASPEKVKTALKKLGFCDVVEVAIGADLCSYGEAKEFLEKVPKEQPFMATSCCPAWSVMAKKNFKDLAPYISMELTPMAFTGRFIKSKNKDVKVCFIGPCTAKKLEAFRKSVRSDVDFVLTFEEVMGMFSAKEIDFSSLTPDEEFLKTSGDGRKFAVSNGVAMAVANCLKEFDKDKEVLFDSAQGLKNCKTMLLMAKAGKRDGYLLEGMACEGGCVGGPGTLQPTPKATKMVNDFAKDAEKVHAFESEFVDSIDELLD